MVLPLQLVVENDAPQAVTALREPLGGLQVGSIDLASIVFGRPTLRLQQLSSLVRQRDDAVSMTRERHRLDESALEEMAEV